MLKHKNLDAPRIRNLVREDAVTGKFDDASVAMFSDLLLYLGGIFDRGRRLRAEELKTVMDIVDSRIREGFLVVRSGKSNIPPTRIKPKGESYENRYIAVHRIEANSYILVAYRLLGTRKVIRLEQAALPIGFTYHAAERMLERAADVEMAFRQIAESLLEYMVFTKLGEVPCVKNLACDLLIPDVGGHGALLGGIYEVERKPERFDFRIEGMFTSHPKPFWGLSTRFVAHTFIGTSQMREEQIALSDAIRAWKEGRQSFNDDLFARTCWYDSITEHDPAAEWDDDTFPTLWKETADILGTDAAARAISRQTSPILNVSLKSTYPTNML